MLQMMYDTCSNYNCRYGTIVRVLVTVTIALTNAIIYVQVDMKLFLHCILSTGHSRLYICQRYAVVCACFEWSEKF